MKSNIKKNKRIRSLFGQLNLYLALTLSSILKACMANKSFDFSPKTDYEAINKIENNNTSHDNDRMEKSSLHRDEVSEEESNSYRETRLVVPDLKKINEKQVDNYRDKALHRAEVSGEEESNGDGEEDLEVPDLKKINENQVYQYRDKALHSTEVSGEEESNGDGEEDLEVQDIGGIYEKQVDNYRDTALHSPEVSDEEESNGDGEEDLEVQDTGVIYENQVDQYGNTALHRSIFNGNANEVELLLNIGKIDLNKTDRYLRTALHLAVKEGYDDIVKLLIESGKCDLNKADRYLRTALHLAAEEGYDDIVKLLIESGKCDLNKADYFGSDIWTYYPPEEEGNLEIVNFLIKYGAKYREPKVNNDSLIEITNNTQSAHKERLACKKYKKFKENKVDSDLKELLRIESAKFIELLKNHISSLENESYIEIVKNLITSKYSNMLKDGQGKNFIDNLRKILKLEEKKINQEILKKAIDELTIDEKTKFVNCYKQKTLESIDYYYNTVSNIFQGLNVTMKDFFGLMGIQINELTEDKINNAIAFILEEFLDAGTMYESGNASCLEGMVNKMFTSVESFFDTNIKGVEKEAFPFEGFTADYTELLVLATIKIQGPIKEKLITKLIGKRKKFTSLEVQKIASKVYEILKNTKTSEIFIEGYKDPWCFNQIFTYGQGNNVLERDEKIREFCNTIDNKNISEVTYGNIFKEENNGYFINLDNITYDYIDENSFLPTAKIAGEII
jgi:ankyrin repeat protein